MLNAGDHHVAGKYRVKTRAEKRLLKIHEAACCMDLYISESQSPGVDLFIEHLRAMCEGKQRERMGVC